MTLIAIFFSLLYLILDCTEKKVLSIPLSMFVILFGYSIDTIDNEYIINTFFIFDKVVISAKTYIFYFITLFSLFIGMCFSQYIFKPQDNKISHYNIKRIVQVYYILSVISLLAFSINFNRVLLNGGISLMFTSPRHYEELFGASSVINYLFFLNVPALCVFVYLYSHNVKVKFSVILNILLVIISFFHGIKFTIFDTILFPFFVYYFLSDKLSFKSLVYVGVVLCAIFILFSVFVRGANDNNYFMSLVSYVLPNYYNMFYMIEDLPLQFDLSAFYYYVLPNKTPNLLAPLGISEPFRTGFFLNDSYNMVTLFEELYPILSILSPILIIPLIIFLCYCYNKKSKSIIYLFLTAYLQYSFYFMFYYYAFNKIKYVYLIIVISCIHFYCKNKDTQHTTEETLVNTR